MRRGITLIEMMVVVAVLGIIIALAAPAFGDLIARQRLRSYNDGLITDIAFARSEAVARRETVRLAFGSIGGTECYVIYVGGGGNCNCACTGGAEPLKTVRFNASDGVSASSATTASDGRREVPFNAVQAIPEGLAAAYDITLAHARGSQIRSSIQPLGHVRVCSPNNSIGGVPEC